MKLGGVFGVGRWVLLLYLASAAKLKVPQGLSPVDNTAPGHWLPLGGQDPASLLVLQVPVQSLALT